MCNSLVTPWTLARQAPISMVFPRQEHWSGLPFLLQEIFLSQKSHLGLLNGQEDLYHGATGEAHAADDHLLKPTQGTVPSVSPM